MIRLTTRALRAIIEALNARLAGELDVEGLERRDYERALEWAQEERERRGARA